jgi:methyl-accepting chemotaxis protein
MKRFKDMKIAKKLVIGFIVVALIAGIVGCFGIYFTKTINYAGTRLYKENTLGIKYVADADILYQRIRYNGLKMMLDKSQAGTLQKKIDTFKDQLEECWQEYEKTVSSNEERELYDELAKDWISYSKYTDTVTEYILKDKVDKAKELIFGDMATTGSNLQTVVDKLFELNSKQARVRSEQNDALEQSALYIMVIIIVAGMLFAVLLGIIISRIISVPVNKMKDTANQLALGDVNVNIDINSKDEIGDLAESMKLMISNIREQAKAAERLAEGDLSIDVAVRSDQDLLGRKLYELVEKNNEVIYNIAAASDQVAAGSKQISDSGVALSQGATEQASTIEQLTASLEEISSQTKLNAENAGQANELAETADQYFFCKYL